MEYLNDLKSEIPIERAQTLHSIWYNDQKVLDLENEHIFKQEWVYAGHRNQLHKSNSILKLKISNEPILIIENSKNEIKAFIDVCKHRGGPLCLRKGSKNVLQCQYHGWTYTESGDLRGVPEFNKVELFEKSDFKLNEVQTKIVNDLIFVKIDNTSYDQSNSFEEFVLDLQKRTKHINWNSLSFENRISYPIKCNWKIYIDNYLEGYHIPHVHPELNKLIDYRDYTTELGTIFSLQHAHFKEGAQYGNTTDEALYYFIYPNCMLNILPGRLQMNRVDPIDKDNCIVHFDYFYDKNLYSEARIHADQEYSEEVQKEDEEICEMVSERLKSSTYTRGRFSVKQEQGVYHFQQLLKSSIRKGLDINL